MVGTWRVRCIWNLPVLYHLSARGNARQKIFLDEADRERFIELLGKEIMAVWDGVGFTFPKTNGAASPQLGPIYRQRTDLN
jgi:hypothetical protein